MTDAIHPFATVTETLTGVAVDVNAASEHGGDLRLYSDRKFHVAVDADATVDDMPVNSDCAEIITSLSAGQKVSVIKAAGETDGTIWATFVARS
ncbi:MAG: hypothetical protein RIA09_15795 [Hoeflea sp.]|jgi:hypothetical protein|uniref:hypothetical protein n=1 Tax=Hoeflea sp. TaxID=1940281 RepID=UPI0032F0733B